MRRKKSWRGVIDTLKNNIRFNTRPFDGCGYPFKKALSELRREGVNIKYIRKMCHYIVISNKNKMKNN